MVGRGVTPPAAILVGFAVGSGEPVSVPLRNLVVTGQTQESGKTTTLEALVQRSGRRAIAFVTKRGEIPFPGARRIQPYFRERADWQFVDQLLEAQLREKNKFLRPWLIRACRTTKTLADVHQAIKRELRNARGGFSVGIYTQLDAYLELIVPEIGRATLAERIELAPGLNVMDVSGYTLPMQMLFVQSAIDWILERERDVVTIIPEAWEFIPEGKGSPVKASAVALVRKGSALRNHIWVDSQDTAGVDKVILRGCPVWLIGVQREANEIKRNLLNIPADVKRPKPADVARLTRGQFFICFGATTIRTYVQPAWLDEKNARAIARGESHANISTLFERFVRGGQRAQAAADEVLRRHEEVTKVTPEEAKHLRDLNADLRKRVAELEKELLRLQRDSPDAVLKLGRPGGLMTANPVPPSQRAEGAGRWRRTANDYAELYDEIKARLLEELPEDPRVLKILATRPELQVEITKAVIEASGETLFGRLAQLIAEGFFDEPRAGNAAFQELKRRGFATAKPNVYREADKLAAKGFLTKEGDGYKAVPGMKVNIIERGE
jgi:hypothetical protein